MDNKQATDDLKKKFVGFDENGNPVFGDNGTYSSLDKNDFSDITNQLQKEQPNKKFSDYFSDVQAKNITQNNQYLGDDAQGNSVFKNQSGIIDRAKGEFQAGLKRQFGNVTFDKSQQGFSNDTGNENAIRVAPSKRDESQQQSQFQMPKQQEAHSFNVATDKSAKPAPQPAAAQQAPVVSGNATLSANAPQQTVPQTPKLAPTNNSSQYEIINGIPHLKGASMRVFRQETGAWNAAHPGWDAGTSNTASSIGSNGIIGTLGDITKVAVPAIANYATGGAFSAAAPILESAVHGGNISNTLGNVAKNAATNAADYYTDGMYSKVAPVAQAVINGQDISGVAKKAAIDYATQQAQPYLNQINSTLGGLAPQGMDVNPTLSQLGNTAFSTLMNGGNVQKALTNQVGSMASNQLGDFITNAGGNSAAAGLGASTLRTLINGGNVQQALTNQATDLAKQQAMNQIIGTSNPYAGAALAAGNVLTGNGSSEDKGRAAAKAAAETALNAYTGGLYSLVNPTTLGIASQVFSKDKNLAGLDASVGNMANTSAQIGNAALNTVGDIGAAQGQTWGNALQGSKDVIKNLTKGNIGTALGGLANTGLQLAIDNLIKNPVKLVSSIGTGIGNAATAAWNGAKKLVSWVCFAPGTEILMKDGSYKKVDDLKLDDEISMGGKIMAIGTGKGTEFVVIKGVHVIETHALFEDGKWIRASESKNVEKRYHKADGIVYPIVTENHLVVTKGQVWSDTFEHDEQQDMTREEIMDELNKDKHKNSIVKMFLNVKGWDA